MSDAATERAQIRGGAAPGLEETYEVLDRLDHSIAEREAAMDRYNLPLGYAMVTYSEKDGEQIGLSPEEMVSHVAPAVHNYLLNENIRSSVLVAQSTNNDETTDWTISVPKPVSDGFGGIQELSEGAHVLLTEDAMTRAALGFSTGPSADVVEINMVRFIRRHPLLDPDRALPPSALSRSQDAFVKGVAGTNDCDTALQTCSQLMEKAVKRRNECRKTMKEQMSLTSEACTGDSIAFDHHDLNIWGDELSKAADTETLKAEARKTAHPEWPASRKEFQSDRYQSLQQTSQLPTTVPPTKDQMSEVKLQGQNRRDLALRQKYEAVTKDLSESEAVEEWRRTDLASTMPYHGSIEAPKKDRFFFRTYDHPKITSLTSFLPSEDLVSSTPAAQTSDQNPSTATLGMIVETASTV
ncbi:hypothetical protein IAT40_007349 [Kwoniella sp. CBS 6097]